MPSVCVVISTLYIDSKEGGGGGGGEGVRCGGVEMKKERMKVLAVDHALRRETQRASRLAEELHRVSITRDKLNPILSPGCVYKVTLTAFPTLSYTCSLHDNLTCYVW